jgi:hypothetical protein
VLTDNEHSAKSHAVKAYSLIYWYFNLYEFAFVRKITTAFRTRVYELLNYRITELLRKILITAVVRLRNPESI